MQPERQSIITEARSWLGTPFRHRQSVKGSGCDCLTLWIAVYEKVLNTCIPIPDYPPDEHQHRAGEPYADGLRQYFEELGKVRPLPADLVSFHFGARQVAHIGIMVDRDWFIAAIMDRGKVELNRLSDAYWANRWTGTWRWKPWATA